MEDTTGIIGKESLIVLWRTKVFGGAQTADLNKLPIFCLSLQHHSLTLDNVTQTNNIYLHSMLPCTCI